MGLAGVRDPGKGLGQIQYLFGPDDLGALSLELLKDGASYAGFEDVRLNGQRPNFLRGVIWKHLCCPSERSPGDSSGDSLTDAIPAALPPLGVPTDPPRQRFAPTHAGVDGQVHERPIPLGVGLSSSTACSQDRNSISRDGTPGAWTRSHGLTVMRCFSTATCSTRRRTR